MNKLHRVHIVRKLSRAFTLIHLKCGVLKTSDMTRLCVYMQNNANMYINITDGGSTRVAGKRQVLSQHRYTSEQYLYLTLSAKCCERERGTEHVDGCWKCHLRFGHNASVIDSKIKNTFQHKFIYLSKKTIIIHINFNFIY